MTVDLTATWAGFSVLALFAVGYALVIVEEFTNLPKSIPIVVAGGLIWVVIAIAYAPAAPDLLEDHIDSLLVEYGQLFLFLLVAMTYVNSLGERGIFGALRAWLANRGFSLKALFWITGFLSFFLSPFIDNLTTALVMSAIVVAVAKDNRRFIGVACVNIVVAANAGGAFSPFGDITTLMVWQSGRLAFADFLVLFVPSFVSFLIPACVMAWTIDSAAMPAPASEKALLHPGAFGILALFFTTIALAVSFHNYLHLPPFLGMVVGLALLQLYGYYLNRTHARGLERSSNRRPGDIPGFNGFAQIARAEWDTLLFFFGVIMAVGGLGIIGYLTSVSVLLYGNLGATIANSMIGLLSAVVDNIPVMVAVLQMSPSMNDAQWLLVTLTTGIGGSLLSIGSAAGVALMGQARGSYTFVTHLRWSPVIGIGYVAGIVCHLWING